MLPHLLVVGIGNIPLPLTRHSLGHYVLNSLASRCGVTLKDNSALNGFMAKADVTLNDRPAELTLFKPKPLMNIVGQPVARALRQTVQTPSRLVVLQDSLIHEPGRLKTKFGGSPQGHRGIRSIAHSLNGEQGFHRLQLGIGRAGPAAEYVLGPLTSFEKQFWGENGEGVDLVWKELEKIARQVEEQGEK